MNAFGIVALLVGLWLVMPEARVVGREPVPVGLGWALIAAAAILVLTSTLDAPRPLYSTMPGEVTPSDYQPAFPPAPHTMARLPTLTPAG